MKNIKYIGLILLVFVIISNNLYSQNWDWAHDFSGVDNVCKSLDVDGQDNIYITGSFEDFIVFENDTFWCQGINDIFISKLNSSGEMIWFKSPGGITNCISNCYGEGGRHIKYDQSTSSLIVTGTFVNNGVFDSFTIPGPEIWTSFIAKYDLNGNCIWVNPVYSINTMENALYYPGNVVTNNDIYYIGSNAYDAEFEYSSNPFDTLISLPAGIFIAKYDNNGEIKWAKLISPGKANCSLNEIQDNLLVSGTFSDSIDICENMLLSHGDYNNMFINLIDTLCNSIWIKQIYSEIDIQSQETKVDNDDNIVITGSFLKNLIIENDTLIANSNKRETFLIKLSSSGSLIWMQNFEVSDTLLNTYYPNIAIESTDNIILQGIISGDASFGIYDVESLSPFDMVLARFSPDGNCLGVDNFGPISRGYHMNVSVDNSDKYVISGVFTENFYIGSNQLIFDGEFSNSFIAKCDTSINHIGKNQNAFRDLIIFPNPADGTCFIKLPDGINLDRNALLYIYDSNGKLVELISLNNSDFSSIFELNQKATGTFLVLLENGNERYHGKIIFQ